MASGLVRPLRLAEYAPEFGDAAFWVWLDVPPALIAEYEAALDRAARARQAVVAIDEGGDAAKLAEELVAAADGLFAWFAVIWSQGPDPATHWTRDEVRQFVTRAMETDPVLWDWVAHRTTDWIAEFTRNRRRADAALLGWAEAQFVVGTGGRH